MNAYALIYFYQNLLALTFRTYLVPLTFFVNLVFRISVIKKLIVSWIFIHWQELCTVYFSMYNLRLYQLQSPALFRQLDYYITFIIACQGFFQNFLKSFRASLVALSSGDLYIILHFSPFVNTFFKKFSTFLFPIYLV